MTEIVYDDPEFFAGYTTLERRRNGVNRPWVLLGTASPRSSLPTGH